MIERWRIVNMFYRIIELEGRDDLVRVLLSNMNFSLYGRPIGANFFHIKISLGTVIFASCYQKRSLLARRYVFLMETS